MNDNSLMLVLAELEQFFRTHARYAHADVVERAITLHDRDPAAFDGLIQGSDFWGGSGAVWEVFVKGDKGEMRRLVIALAEAMEASGIGTSRSREIAGALRRTLDSTG
jgi:hypothetical protein